LVSSRPTSHSSWASCGRRANLVVTRKSGGNVYYRLADRRLAKLLDITKRILIDYLTAARDQLTNVKS